MKSPKLHELEMEAPRAVVTFAAQRSDRRCPASAHRSTPAARLLHGNRRFIALLLGCTALLPGAGFGCHGPDVAAPFDALECVELARTAPERTGYLFRNRCREPIALLVVTCDLRARPGCRTDPLHSFGWSTRRGIEYLSAAQPVARPIDASWSAHSAARPLVSGPREGSRAQIAACRLRSDAAAFETDPCALRLAMLKRALDATPGASLRAILREAHGVCPGLTPAHRQQESPAWE